MIYFVHKFGDAFPSSERDMAHSAILQGYYIERSRSLVKMNGFGLNMFVDIQTSKIYELISIKVEMTGSVRSVSSRYIKSSLIFTLDMFH